MHEFFVYVPLSRPPQHKRINLNSPPLPHPTLLTPHTLFTFKKTTSLCPSSSPSSTTIIIIIIISSSSSSKMALGTLPSLLSLLFVFGAVITIAGEAAAAGRSFPPKESTAKKDDVKHPEWLFGHHDGSFLIPGIGRVLVPPECGYSPRSPSVGSTGGTGSTGAGPNHNYVPGGDDTFVPNPGVEVPNPGRGGGGGGHVP